MTDLLTHVLFVYVVLTVASWRYRWLTTYVPVAMVGAVIPDLAKIRILVGPTTVETLVGLPFSWDPLHRLGGAVLVAGVVALFFTRCVRRRAFGFLLLGVTTGFLLDAGLIRANGVTPPYLYPLMWWQPPAAGLYLSSDAWPAAVAICVAAFVWALDTRRIGDRVRDDERTFEES